MTDLESVDFMILNFVLSDFLEVFPKPTKKVEIK